MTTPTRILVITSWYPSDRDPVEGLFVEDQARALASRFDVRVIAPRLARGVSLRRRLPPTDVRHGLRVIRPLAQYAVPRRLTWMPAAKSARSAILDAFESLTSDGWRPDLIHAHVILPAGWAAAELGAREQVPVVLTEHTSPFRSAIHNTSSRRLVREAAQRAAVTIAVSPALKQEMKAFLGPIRIDVVPNLFDSSLLQLDGTTTRTRHPAAIKIAAIGSLIPRKGFDVLIQAVSILDRRGIRTLVDLVGSGPEAFRLANMVKELNLDSVVRLRGQQSRDAVRELLAGTDLLVLSSRAETFGVVLIEAMASGKPVVATRCGGPDSIVTEEVGILVDVDDPAAMADAIQSVARWDLQARGPIIARTAFERFGPQHVVDQLARIYDEVLAHRRSA